MTPPRTETPPLRVLNGGARPTCGMETPEVISPELALVDPELAARARSALRTYDSDELVAEVKPTSHANEIAPEPSGDKKTVLSPELALVDPELADWARARLAIGEQDSPAAPVDRPAEPPRALRPFQMHPHADQTEPVEPTHRARTKRSVVAAVLALAAGLGGVAAIWTWYDDGSSISRGTEDAPFQPRREQSPAVISERGQTKTRTASKGVVGQRYGARATRSGRLRTGGSPRRRVRAQTLGQSRPAAFHVPGAPKEPLDEIPLPARARRLSAWLTPSRRPTAANQRHWLYQHAWIVTGARFGWWHGATALRLLIRIDRRIERQWGIGYLSEGVARTGLAAVEASEK